jgi:hypothetical protein
MWEWFTTKPFADAGECRFIGSVPTPWPSWLIAAHPSPERTPPEALKRFLSTLSEYVRTFDSAEKREKENVDFIVKTWNYPEEDVRQWLDTVKYPQDCATIPEKVITETLRYVISLLFATSLWTEGRHFSVLEQAGFIQKPASGFTVGDFVDENVMKLT